MSEPRGVRALRAVRAWTADRFERARARVGEGSAHALAAGGVRAAATALELATGPLGGTLVAAGAEAAVLAIATDAVRRALADAATEADLRAVLAVVIAELAREELCEAHVADGWRAACGLDAPARGGQALVVGLRRAAVAVVGSRVATAALRRAGLKKLMWVGSAVAVARLPAEVRRACELVRRAEQRARVAVAGGEAGLA
ncbi:hypothetical protein [Nannocystis punicea]|uniref:EcsC protein family protein n=1 Tax=Nannocystis punicea TaxID=2995304 RepID=A0ABY7HBS4_9BACT|nr:hypothetical protein [Nannocystis poenicansa]WAS96558.1 hypothetical protein O0S08_10405 [Nannocystis poenicansa]